MLLIQHTPDVQLSTLLQLLKVQRGVSVDKSTIWRSLHRAGYSRKKVSISALEQNEETRCQYLLTVGLDFLAEQLVFVDESACNRVTARRPYAWSLVGTCARRHDYFIRGKRRVSSVSCGFMFHSFFQRYSILPAMSLDGILHLAIQDSPYTALQFNSFIEALLENMNQFPQSNSVIVMDNASIHKSPELRQMVEEWFVHSYNNWYME